MEHLISDQFSKFDLKDIEKYFEWPIPHESLISIQYDILQEMIAAIRGANSEGDCYDIAVVIFLSFSMEIIRVIQSSHLAENIRRNPIIESVTSSYELTKSLYLKNESVKISGKAGQLTKGFSKSYAKKYGRVFKYYFKLNNSNIRLKCGSVNNHVVTFLLDEMAHTYANNFEEKLIYYPLDEIFIQPSKRELEKIQTLSSLRDALYKIAIKNLDMHASKQFRTVSQRHIVTWLDTAWNYTGFYLNLLRRKFKRLPTSVCVGSGAAIWYRIIARFMIGKGVEVIRFDHGSSNSFYDNTIEQAHFEFEDCSKFYTFFDMHAKLYRNTFKGDLTVQNEPPVIGYIGQNDIFKNRHNSGIKRATNLIEGLEHTKKVLFIVNLFSGENYYMCSPKKLCDVSLYHFTRTVYEYITSLGIQLTLKPHPSIQKQPHAYEYLKSFCPIEQINFDPFEDTYFKYDTILFSNPKSTVFSTIMSSGKKIIYIDIGAGNFLREVKELFEMTAHIVNGDVRHSGLVKIDWVSMKAALESPSIKTNDFQKKYLFA